MEKTKVMKVNAKNQEGITINGLDNIEEVEAFTYLGAKMCKEGGGVKDLKNRLSKARGSFVRLKTIWNSKSVTRKTKLKLYRTLVVLVLLYGCETWKMNKSDDKEIDVFQNKCIRKILEVRWQDHVSTEELLERAEMEPLSRDVKRRRWKLVTYLERITTVMMQ